MQFKNWFENRRIDYLDYNQEGYPLLPDLKDRMPSGLEQNLRYIRMNDGGAFSEQDDTTLERFLSLDNVKGDAQKLLSMGLDKAFSSVDAENFLYQYGGDSDFINDL